MVKHHHNTLCYHCGVQSAENVFKYYDNGKATQPRYQCGNCQKYFTVGSHGRPQGRTYAKQRNVDPPELKGLRRECRCCGVANNAPFKYYNNSNRSQPRFKCLSCGQQFQMRLMGIGEERRLVHTSSYQRPPTSDLRKLSLAPKLDGVDISEKMQMQAAVDAWVPALEPGVELFPTLSDEDAKYLDLIETVDAWVAALEPGVELELFPTLSDEEAKYVDLIEAVDAWVPALEPGVELFPTLSDEDAKYLDLIEA